MTDSSKQDPIILLTGAAGGIGRACTEHLSSAGYQVWATVRTPQDAHDLISACPHRRIRPLQVDLCDQKQFEVLLDQLQQELAHRTLTAVIHNAGMVQPAPLELLPAERWEQVFQLNVTVPMRLTQQCLPALRRSRPPGRIILIGSISGLIGFPMLGAYCASKHALEALADCLRQELANQQIPVSLLQPGPVQTPIWEKSQDQCREVIDQLSGQQQQIYDAYYRPLLARLQTMQRSATRSRLPVQAVVQQVDRMLHARRPPTRLVIGPGDRWSTRLLRWLPDRWRDRLIRHYLNKFQPHDPAEPIG